MRQKVRVKYRRLGVFQKRAYQQVHWACFNSPILGPERPLPIVQPLNFQAHFSSILWVVQYLMQGKFSGRHGVYFPGCSPRELQHTTCLDLCPYTIKRQKRKESENEIRERCTSRVMIARRDSMSRGQFVEQWVGRKWKARTCQAKERKEEKLILKSGRVIVAYIVRGYVLDHGKKVMRWSLTIAKKLPSPWCYILTIGPKGSIHA